MPLDRAAYVLIVDDHKLRRQWTKRALSGERFHVYAASSAKQGLQYLRQVQFDAVVLGEHLRGVGANEFQEKVRRLYPETEVVVVSFTWPVGRDTTTLSPGAYHSLVLCSQGREMTLRTMVAEALSRASGGATGA